MAVMWPRQLPREILHDPKRAAEVMVFDAFKAALPDPFEVFYSRPWLGLNHLGEEIDGECDFLVAHPELGILTLEVKGGGISRDAASDTWRSKDKYGIQRRIKDPVRQARDAKHQILEKLKKALPSLGWLNLHHGVIFPHVEGFKEDLGIDMPRSLFCCSLELEQAPYEWVLQRLNSDGNLKYGRRESLGEWGMEGLRSLIAKSFYLEMPLGKRLESDDEELQTLTMRQATIFKYICEIPRVAISGAAGTGKTVLARQEAIRQADDGRRTALLCYNQALVRQLQFDPALASRPSITVSTFPALFSAATDERDHDTVSVKLTINDSRSLPLFDSVIIDEGQDFPREWWSYLDRILAPGGRLRVFWDSNQALYGALPTLPREVELLPIRLDANLRNTAAIWEVASRYYTGHTVTAEGPLGHPVDVRRVATEFDAGVQLKALLAGWTLGNDGKHLAVLVPDEAWLKKAETAALSKGLRVRRCDQPDQEGVIIDTIRRFKGLECRELILVLTQESILSKELVYVGLSRARVRLAVIAFGQGQVVSDFLVA